MASKAPDELLECKEQQGHQEQRKVYDTEDTAKNT